jgi:hypothetical protein
MEIWKLSRTILAKQPPKRQPNAGDEAFTKGKRVGRRRVRSLVM